jgi:disulfide bond formation protein DsbB
MLTDQINFILAIFTLLGLAFIVLALIYLLFFQKSHNRLTNFISKNGITLAFIIALVSTLGSLYYSEIVGLIPCDLCWIQRIFMYPQVVLLGLAWWKKDDGIIPYSLALLGIGTLFAVYHNYIYYGAQPVVNFCSIVSPCVQQYVVGFGFIGIPLMSLTAFLMIGLLLICKKINHKQTLEKN